jgi:hypothetical protein
MQFDPVSSLSGMQIVEQQVHKKLTQMRKYHFREGDDPKDIRERDIELQWMDNRGIDLSGLVNYSLFWLMNHTLNEQFMD